ncbi:MAG: hypothetical protein ACKVH8_06820 [Pirellulales bacterium]
MLEVFIIRHQKHAHTKARGHGTSARTLTKITHALRNKITVDSMSKTELKPNRVSRRLAFQQPPYETQFKLDLHFTLA